MPLKSPSEFSLIGQDVAALDIAQKTTGEAVYGLDVKVGGMVYGVPLIPPTRQGSSVISIDDSAAKDQKGYLKTIDLQDPSGIVPGMVVVIGTSLMAAKWVSEVIDVEWAAGDTADVSEEDIQNLSRQLIADGQTGGILPTGDHDTAPRFTTAPETLEADYTTSTVLHFTLEPMNATAFRNRDGQYEIHAGSQWPALMEKWVQAALGLEANKVVMHGHMIGGGFGRRVFGDYGVAAALASKALDGAPVKLVFFREDGSLIDRPRPPSAQRLRMAFDKDNNVTGMDHSAAAGWPAKSVNAAPDFIEGVNGQIYDTTALSGADHWYNVGAHKVRGIYNELASRTVRSGFLRSTGPGWTSFAVESFMDEAAHMIGVDPLAFRLQHLDGAGRNAVGRATQQANVLKRVADLCGYGRADLGPDTAIGIASTFGMEREMPTWNGTAVQLRVDRSSGKVDIQKIWLVIDCGTVIDPNGARAQCEGAALWGLSMALHEGTHIQDGQVYDSNLSDYTPLRLIDVPDLEIEFVESTEAPVGLGEPGVTGIAPASANAIFNAVGGRMRHLRMTPMQS